LFCSTDTYWGWDCPGTWHVRGRGAALRLGPRKGRDRFEKLSIILKWNVKCIDMFPLAQGRDVAGLH